MASANTSSRSPLAFLRRPIVRITTILLTVLLCVAADASAQLIDTVEVTRDGTRQIWTMLADGTQARQLTFEGHNESPNWSPK
jgi:hypothetical protein